MRELILLGLNPLLIGGTFLRFRPQRPFFIVRRVSIPF